MEYQWAGIEIMGEEISVSCADSRDVGDATALKEKVTKRRTWMRDGRD